MSHAARDPARPTPTGRRSRTLPGSSRGPGWRLLVPVVFAVAGALAVTSAISSGGTDLRAGRYDDLPGLLQDQSREVARLRAEQAQLTAQVDVLTAGLGAAPVRREQARAARLRGPAGFDAAAGPGLTITLSDAPQEQQASVPRSQVSNLIVHQQDIQAVANALWAGGASAMTIQGQRVVSTTGIKCVGNTVVLHDVPYAPPYRIAAIGPVTRMLASVHGSDYIAAYLDVVDRYQLGWQVHVDRSMVLPGYDGPTEIRHARPLTAAG